MYLTNTIFKTNDTFNSFSGKFLQYNYLLKNLRMLPGTKEIHVLEKEFKSSFTHNYSVSFKYTRFVNPPKFLYTSNRDNGFILKSFKTFAKINIHNTRTLKVHNSFFIYYLSFTSSNTSVVSLKKLFSHYKNFFFFVTNIFYYKIAILFFGNLFFKKELLSLNWCYLSQFNFLWRYTKPFLYLYPSRIHDGFYTVFKNLKFLNFHTALILDVFYHDKTIHYLNKNFFYSFGLVPINMSRYTVNFAIPTGQENFLSQVFFIRFVLISKKQTESHIYKHVFSSWNFLMKSIYLPYFCYV